MRNALWILLAVGCGADAAPKPPATPTWYQDVAPLVAGHCQSCHVDGGIAPFALATYDDAATYSKLMLDQVNAGRMPPFGAVPSGDCAPPLPFKDDPSLSATEIATLAAWVDAGAPAGDAATAAPLPTPPDRHLAGVTTTVVPVGSFTTSGATDQFECMVYDPNLATDVWLTGIEFQPTDTSVVHHAIAVVDPTRASAALAGPDGVYDCFGGVGIPQSTTLGGYVPGAMPFETLPGTGIKIPAGALIVVQFHYHPLGSPVPVLDKTSLALRLQATNPGRTAVFVGVGNQFAVPYLQPDPDDRGAVEFRIPAEVASHTETLRIPLPVDPGTSVPIFGVGPHMHYLGTRMEVDLEHADGTKTCLIDASRYDFSWQRLYAYDGGEAALPRARAGDTAVIRCTYDNTMSNPNVVRALKERGLVAPVDVYYGETTLDEMCIFLAGAVVP